MARTILVPSATRTKMSLQVDWFWTPPKRLTKNAIYKALHIFRFTDQVTKRNRGSGKRKSSTASSCEGRMLNPS